MSEPVADAAVRAVPPDATRVAVVGAGGLARAVRHRLGERASVGGERPAAIVETSGTRDGIEAALRDVADLGTVVLAGPRPAEPFALDFYADLHVRGLTVMGIAESGETLR
jgi:threonine dehydrogenase-like Zn-dependent dehydrogenase